MNLTCFCLISCIILTCNVSFAQTSIGNNWYFGNHAGITFPGPVAVTGGAMNTSEGCATISDNNGQLLFYTDGVTVWNSLHVPVATGLFGHSSSTQSAIITPRPGSPNEYYIITVDAPPYWSSGRGIYLYLVTVTTIAPFVTVDMNYVQLLPGPVCEKITAVCKGDSSENLWLIAHGWDQSTSRTFYVWEITPLGPITPPPAIHEQIVGETHFGWNDKMGGYLKASQQGDKLALASSGSNISYEDGFFDLFSFASNTGIISYLHTFPINQGGVLPNWTKPYGIEFSPDGAFFYGTCGDPGSPYVHSGQLPGVYQFNTSNYNVVAVHQDDSAGFNYFGALQLAPDGNIYVARSGLTYLSNIVNPNGPPTWNEQAIVLAQGTNCNAGLPNFVQCLMPFTDSLAMETEIFYGEIPCQGCLRITATGGTTPYQYRIDGGNWGPNNIFCPIAVGTHLAEVMDDNGTIVSQTVTIITPPSPILQLTINNSVLPCCPNLIVSGGTPHHNPPYYHFSWSDGTTNPNLDCSPKIANGKYFVTVEDSIGCKATDTIIVDCGPCPPVNDECPWWSLHGNNKNYGGKVVEADFNNILGINEVDDNGVTNPTGSLINLSPLRFFTDSKEKMRILSTGEVGIGTTTPSDLLEVKGNLSVTGNGADGISGIMGHKSKGLLTISANNWSGDGPGIDLNGANRTTGNKGGIDYISHGNNGMHVFKHYNVVPQTWSNQMIIDANGNVGIGITPSTYKLDVNGQLRIIGGILANGNAITSDSTLKKNINIISNALTTINQLHPKTFDFRVNEFPYLVIARKLITH